MNASSATNAETDPIDAEFEPTETKNDGRRFGNAPGWTGFGILFVVLLLLLSYVIWNSVTATPAATPAAERSDPDRMAGIEQTLSGLRDQTDQQAVAIGALNASLSRLNQDVEALKTQISALETQTAELDDRIVESDSATGSLTVPQSLIDRISGLESAIQSAERSSAEIASVQEQLQTLRGQIELGRPSQTADRLPQASLALIAINAEAARGRPFVLGYQQLSTALPDNTIVAGLAPYAQSGVPTRAELTTDFATLHRSALDEATQADGVEPNWVDQVFGDNVRVTRTAATPLVETLDRAASALEDGDLDAAIRHLDTLPAAPAERFDDWIASAQDRIDLDQRLDSLQLLLVSLAQ